MTNYPVSEIFSSLQGEGHFVGSPMTFVRLAGCSVRTCSIRGECDEAPWRATERLSATEIVERLGTSRIVCITGGEPSDHDLIPLVDRLHMAGHRVHIETSGVRALTGIPVEWLTVSPKTSDYAQRTGNVLKVVVRPGWGWSEVDMLDQDTTFFHRYLQPMTGTDGFPANLVEVTEMLLEPRNTTGRWALSTQAHKTWRLP